MIRTARGQSERRPALGSTDPRKRQATNLFSRANQTPVTRQAIQNPMGNPTNYKRGRCLRTRRLRSEHNGRPCLAEFFP